MKKIIKCLFVTLLALLLILGTVSCNGKTENTTSSTTEKQNPPDDTPEDVTVRAMVFSGTTGFGMAPLMDKNSKKESANKYNFTVEGTDVSNVIAALVNGSVDIAALPTNAASLAYNKTNGGVKVLALNTKGVLYLVQTGSGAPVTSLSDLDGKTVYTPAQNPAFVFKYICEKSGVNVNIDSTKYAKPADLRTVVASGEVEYAVLPEPMVTIAQNAAKKVGINVDVRLDLTAEWNKLGENSGELVQGCVVVRTEFAEKYPQTVKKFLEEYEESIKYVNEHPEEASNMISEQGVFAQAPIAKLAIPKCNIFFAAGEEMKTMLSGYIANLYTVNATSVGGKIPDDAFYYIAK